MLELPYPGGPEISKLTKKGNPRAINFPRPMINSKDLNFSFSGLKTSVLYFLREHFLELPKERVLQDLAQPRHGGASRAIRQQADMRVLAKSDSKAQKNAGTKFSPADIAASFEQAVVDVLVKKTMKAAEQYKPKTIVLGGGVAANDRLREELSNQIQRNFPLITFHLPLLKFTGDNAAMIAVAAYFRAIKKQFANPKTLKAQGNLKLK